MRFVPSCVQQHMLHYLQYAYIVYNRITMSGSATMLSVIPNNLKSTKVRMTMMMMMIMMMFFLKHI